MKLKDFMKYLAFAIAVSSFLSLFFSLVATTQAGDYKARAELSSNYWIYYNQQFLDNQENTSMKEQSDNFRALTIKNTNDASIWGVKAGLWQVSAQGYIISLMCILAGFTTEKRKWREPLYLINLAAALLYAYALLTFVYAIFV